jgi:hypothetical protein
MLGNIGPSVIQSPFYPISPEISAPARAEASRGRTFASLENLSSIIDHVVLLRAELPETKGKALSVR